MSIIERCRMFSIGLYCAMTILTLSAGMQPATARALIGAAAPAFTLTDSNGRNLSLADFKGKTVVLEWTNHECPYVGKHYRGNNTQALQKKWTGQGVVWLSVISSAPGQPGYVSPQQANKLTADRGAAPTAVLFDPTGEVGHAYGARTTPHMYVIDGEGALVYHGGIDDKPTARLEDLKSARNFVDQTLSEISQGKPVSVTSARAYGCSIKYGSFRGGILPKSAHRVGQRSCSDIRLSADAANPLSRSRN
jgi:peroxiredoxin